MRSILIFLAGIIAIAGLLSSFSCQTENVALVKKDLQFVGQFNIAFSYDMAGLGPLLQKVQFTEAEVIALARENIPELADLEEIHVVDIGFNVLAGAGHEAQRYDLSLTEDSQDTANIIAIEDLFIDGEFIIDPTLLNLGSTYPEMLENLNALLEGGSIDTYILNLLLEPENEFMMTDMDLEVVFAIKFSFRSCVDAPVGTEAKACGS